MAKKRDQHRSSQSSGHRKSQINSSSQQDQLTHSASPSGAIKIVAFFIISSVIAVVAAYRLRQSSPSKSNEFNVYQRGLVTTDTNYQDILTENVKVSENAFTRRYDYPVLGYITPWNSHGYEMAKRFNSKFTHLSPVWYDLKRYVPQS